MLLFLSGPYNPLRTIGTVPRAYDIFRAYEGMKGRKSTNKEMKKKENVIQNKIQDFKIFWKKKIHYKPTCEVRSV
jgi:hypothetical protein